MTVCAAAGVYSGGALGGMWTLDHRPHVLSETVKLIQLLDCVDDVSHFYRRQLARRLSTRRYLSLAFELNVLNDLGGSSNNMNICRKMLDDVQTSERLITGFKVCHAVFGMSNLVFRWFVGCFVCQHRNSPLST